MGAPMLRALIRAGFPAKGFDIAPKSDADVAAFADGLETLITVVRDTAQTDQVLFGIQALVQTPTLRRIIVSSTLSPRYVADLRACVPEHIILIDAPMSGAQIAVENSTLSFMLGDTDADLDTAHPLFDAMGAHFHRMGEFGTGMQAKVLNNLLAASSTAMTRMVLDWADDAGLNETDFLNLVHTSSGQNWLASGMDTIEFARAGHMDDNSIGILVKDVDSALDALPPDADTALPRAVRDVIRHLKPRP
jgi:3-hydroxyisobutyrate dehydrogenase-like beta-hydroxyacid dehydrogenase